LLLAVAIGRICGAAQTDAKDLVVQSPVRFDFESGDGKGWRKVSGDYPHIDIASTRGVHRGQPFKYHGKRFIGTGELPKNAFSDGMVCELRSPMFTITQRTMTLLVGGGNHPNETYVALCRADDGKELLKETGRNHESMTLRRWDVAKLKGTKVFIKVVDQHTGGWGHVNVDDIRELTPEEETAALLEQLGAGRKRYKSMDEWQKSRLDRGGRTVYLGGLHKAAAIPLARGDVGSVKLRSDGAFVDWRPSPAMAEGIDLPYTFFSLWAQREGEEPVAKVLRMTPVGKLPSVRQTLLSAEFPVATVRYEDSELPASVALGAYSPFVPLADEDSHLPALVVRITVENPKVSWLDVAACASLQNLTPAGAMERLEGTPASLAVQTQRATEKPGPATMCLANLSPLRGGLRTCQDESELWNDFSADGVLTEPDAEPPAPRFAATSSSARLGPGETHTFVFLITWHTPTSGAPCFRRFKDAAGVAAYLAANYSRVHRDTDLFRTTLYDSTLPRWLLERIGGSLPAADPGLWLTGLAALRQKPGDPAKWQNRLRSAYEQRYAVAECPQTEPVAFTDDDYVRAAQLVHHGGVEDGVALAAAAHGNTEGVTQNPWEQDPAGRSYALPLAAQGYRHDAKAGVLGFDPEVTPGDHRSFFCTESAWGTFAQRRRDKTQANTLSVKYGNLSLKELQLTLPKADLEPELLASLRLKSVSAKLVTDGSRARIVFPKPLTLAAGDYLIAQFSW